MSGPPVPPGAPPPGGIPPTEPIPAAGVPGVPNYGGPTQAYATPPPAPYGASHETRGPAAEAAEFARRHLRTPETKEFFKTSEFLVWLLTAASVLIAGLSSDDYGAATAWTLVTALSFAYIVSRGIAKSGSRRAEPERFADR
ncbi:MAG: hypothetical protein QOI98_2152 [Solirubrobacteraceae bacterium]|jgi:hypothetical protein|nr:hypothetical protein [Solirubrobacteraceae bacterium]